MPTVLDQPDDEVAVIHHDSGLTLCHGCSRDWYEKYKQYVRSLSFTRLLAKNCGIHQKCDGCHANFLNMEF